MIRLLFTFFRRVKKARGKQFLKVALATLVIVAFSSSGFMYFEIADKPDLGWADALWWSVVTMTTVGYGDYFPTTFAGRYLIGVPTMIFGISILGYLLSTVAAFLIEARSKELKGMRDLTVSDHILVIHFQSLDRVKEIVHEFRADSKTRGSDIVLIDDQLEEIPAELEDEGVRFVRGCPTRESTLRRANVTEARHAVILARDPQDPNSDNHTLAVALTLEQLHPDLVTVAECLDPERVSLMRKSGCDSVVCIARLSSAMMVQEVLDPGVQRVLRELTSTTYGQQIYVVPIDSMKQWQFGELADHLAAHGLLALGIQRAGEVLLNPQRGQQLQQADQAICLGADRPSSIAVS